MNAPRLERLEILPQDELEAAQALTREGAAYFDSFPKRGDLTSMPRRGRASTEKVGILKRNAKFVAAEGIGASVQAAIAEHDSP